MKAVSYILKVKAINYGVGAQFFLLRDFVNNLLILLKKYLFFNEYLFIYKVKDKWLSG